VQNCIVLPKPLSTGSYSLRCDAPNALHRRRLRTWLVVLVETHCHNTTMIARHSYLNRWTYSILQTLPHYEDIIVSEALRHLKSHTERTLVHIRYGARALRGIDKLHNRHMIACTTALQLQDKLHAYNILQFLGAQAITSITEPYNLPHLPNPGNSPTFPLKTTTTFQCS
jgi:hypothetical protein